MNEIISILQNHPAFPKLIDKINSQLSVNTGKLLLPYIEIFGIPFALQEELVQAVEQQLKTGIMYSQRDSLEIRNFLETVQLINLSKLTLSELLTMLTNHNFQRVHKVLQPGEYFNAGDLVNFWPVGMEHPIRASFFGENFEKAGIYDEIYGRSLEGIAAFYLGDLEKLAHTSGSEQIKISSPQKKLLKILLIFGGESSDIFKSKEDIHFDFTYPPLFFQRFNLLSTEIKNRKAQGYQVALVSKHTSNLPNDLQQYLTASKSDLEAGFMSSLAKVLYLSDRELFGTVFLTKETRQLTSDKARKILAELEGEIEIGDYIVHEDYGIGIYKGIKQEKYEQKIPLGFGQFKIKIIYEDYLLVGYAEGDELYIPLSQIDKITKYIGLENEEPRITRLGKVEWQNFKKKVKANVALIAKELIEHYAKREMAKASMIETDSSDLYERFVQAFPFQETPDQLRTEKEVLLDLEKSRPMNRLIVGDVGFGKTEVAMRAAFKAVEAGFQAGVLCPTTVLAAQHEKVFSDRFAEFPFRVAAVSRFSQAQNKSLVTDLTAGKIDIIVGTHRLLSNDIEFKRLGLLIIDEEQKFGVAQKEKLKKLEYGVHVLSMSATPIPRSLSMALSEIQDISIIQTAPENRKAIKTTVQKMDWHRIVTAISAEVARGGQIYYVHNRVSTINSVFQKLQKLLPKVNFVVAHGQLPTERLEQTMNDFYNKKYDCLVCTTIIENGLDMPNVNTIIIEKAQNFGLGQIYQLRGRVGRSERQAYAYLFYEGESLDEKARKKETEMAAGIESEKQVKSKRKQQHNYLKRLKAVLEVQDLGSGFRLASRDLEIRGAGNLLGKQQHGNINYVGYGLYMQLLAQEIERVRGLMA